MELEYGSLKPQAEKQKQGSKLTPQPCSDMEAAAYASLANSETPGFHTTGSGHVKTMCINEKVLNLRDTYLKLDSVGPIIGRRVIGEYLYGLHQCGGVEHHVQTNVSHKLDANDNRLLDEGMNFFLEKNLAIRMELPDKIELSEEQIRMLKALINQRVGTDALNQGIKSVAAAVKVKVFRNGLEGLYTKEEIQLAQLLGC